jgi:hypothetical protein
MFLNSLRRIFPDAFFGIASTNTTPPLSCLYPATLDFTKALISFSEIFFPMTTNARGTSVPSCSTPITAASKMLGCERSTPSNSAGATCKPLYLISSCKVVSTSFVGMESKVQPSFGRQCRPNYFVLLPRRRCRTNRL